MRNKGLIFIIMSLIILWLNSQSYSYTKATHQAINEHIAQNTVNGFSLNNYVTNNFGFKDGFKESLKGIDANGNETYKKVFEWLGYGVSKRTNLNRYGDWF